ncbi:5891_t:CDS:2 [Diversispora eburnea]|uniref:5891_t:CDS:1 n=1 Tax=Diversispora eburnea TaxID=1213867 RepID=A0A9N9ATQ7_9GLOM|nr:5891_t:CDS:2 [Diversispora eburnea]
MATPETFTTEDLRPPKKIVVPLWVALSLKSQRLCKIILPDWLKIDNLENLLFKEQNFPEFSPVPFYYFEISQMLLRAAEDDLIESEKIRYSLQNLKETRENKIREGLLNLEPIPIKNYEDEFANCGTVEPRESECFVQT